MSQKLDFLLESLENLAADLGNAGIILSLAEVKGPD